MPVGAVPGRNTKRRMAWPSATLSDKEWNPSMARQTPFTSFNKRLHSIRQTLTALLSGRISARLEELEERVFELEKRAEAQATAIANLGTTVALDRTCKSTVSRVLRHNQTHKESSNGKISANATETNCLQSNFGFAGGRNNSNRAESSDTGNSPYHHPIADNTHSRISTCVTGWDAAGHDSDSACYTGHSSLSD